MMEHKLQMMEQQMMDMGALHQRELSAQRHLSLQREWQHRNTMLRMQKEMVEMQQTMLKMQEMLKMKSKAKTIGLRGRYEPPLGAIGIVRFRRRCPVHAAWACDLVCTQSMLATNGKAAMPANPVA